MGSPHLGAPLRARDGALRPAHCHEAPLTVVTVPTSSPPASFPWNSVPSGKPSPLGTANSISPSLTRISVGVACPQSPINKPSRRPLFSDNSIHDARSWVGVLMARSQRPGYDVFEPDPPTVGFA